MEDKNIDTARREHLSALLGALGAAAGLSALSSCTAQTSVEGEPTSRAAQPSAVADSTNVVGVVSCAAAADFAWLE